MWLREELLHYQTSLREPWFYLEDQTTNLLHFPKFKLLADAEVEGAEGIFHWLLWVESSVVDRSVIQPEKWQTLNSLYARNTFRRRNPCTNLIAVNQLKGRGIRVYQIDNRRVCIQNGLYVQPVILQVPRKSLR